MKTIMLAILLALNSFALVFNLADYMTFKFL